MNPQFFGDSHDLFKYDLIASIMQDLKEDLTSFTFVPMLTKNRKPKKKDIAGMDNDELWNFFNKFQGDDVADYYFKTIRKYFNSIGIKTKIFHKSTLLFSKNNRVKYFDIVKADYPKNSLIFFDPDTGLQDHNITEKHLSYSELKDFFDRMDNHSILMVYQHFFRDRKKHSDFPSAIASLVKEKINVNPIKIDDDSIMFLFLVRDPDLKQKLERAHDLYKKKYKGSFHKKMQETS
jgi:hypothetical protein